MERKRRPSIPILLILSLVFVLQIAFLSVIETPSCTSPFLGPFHHHLYSYNISSSSQSLQQQPTQATLNYHQLVFPPNLTNRKCGGQAVVAPLRVPRSWCLEAPAHESLPSFLAAHVYVRIYLGDQPALSKLDLAHWMTYYRHAGFERVYLYDTYVYPWEKVDSYPPIQEGIASGFVAYTDFHDQGARQLWNYTSHRQKKKGNHIVQVKFPRGNMLCTILGTKRDGCPFWI